MAAKHNTSGLCIFLFSMFFSLGFFVYIAYIHPPIELNEVIEQGDGPSLAEQVKQYKTPWVEADFMLQHGQKIYAINCASCHGPTGRGDGPGGAALPIKPRNFVQGDWKQGGSSITLFKTIQAGIEGTTMVSFKHLPVQDRWALVQMIRSITKNKVEDDAAALEAFAQQAE